MLSKVTSIKFDNELNLSQKRLALFNLINKYLPEIIIKDNRNIIHKGSYINLNCSRIGKKKDCTNQCKMIYNTENKSLFCKLKVPNNLSDGILAITIDMLLNKHYNLNKVIYKKESVRNIKNSIDYIIVDNNNIDNFENLIKDDNNQGKKIISDYTFSGTNTENLVQEDDFIDATNQKKLPTEYRRSFKNFFVQDSANYSATSFYKIFTNVYNNVTGNNIHEHIFKDRVKEFIINEITNEIKRL